jgi:Beta-L-arabinofuranosidase, GH127 catalytic domain
LAVLSKTAFLDRAGAWFLNSGIQEASGGVARYFLADAQQNRAVSTEITGYAVSMLTYLYALTRNQQYLDAARRAASFLTKTAWDSQQRIFPFECSEKPLAYFFDSGIIVRGLLSLWRVTGDRELIDIAKECGRSMATLFAAGRHSEYHPILQLPDHVPLPRVDQWSRMPGCYQLKAALAWDDLYEATGEADYLRWYEELLSESLRTHESFLPGAEGDRVMDRLHAYCYFLEAIVVRADRAEVAVALVSGMARVSKYLREIEPQFARADVYAQLLRVRLLSENAGVAVVDRLDASSEAEKLAAFQLHDPDPRVAGGFYFARRGDALQPHINPVSTAFGLQALMMWRQYLDGELKFSINSLI